MIDLIRKRCAIVGRLHESDRIFTTSCCAIVGRPRREAVSACVRAKGIAHGTPSRRRGRFDSCHGHRSRQKAGRPINRWQHQFRLRALAVQCAADDIRREHGAVQSAARGATTMEEGTLGHGSPDTVLGLHRGRVRPPGLRGDRLMIGGSSLQRRGFFAGRTTNRWMRVGPSAQCRPRTRGGASTEDGLDCPSGVRSGVRGRRGESFFRIRVVARDPARSHSPRGFT